LTEGRFAIPNLFGPAFDASQFAWQPFREGVEIARLYGGEADASSAALLRYAPRARVPMHVHRGHEHIVVLSGSQSDDRGLYRAGTLLVSRPGTSHRISSDEGCIVLAIWERPVEIVE
jgi:anti-sigma factor ChrR (cupin superfamily)